MSDREQHGLRGPVKICTEETKHPGMTGPDGQTYPRFVFRNTTEYDSYGRLLISRTLQSDGAPWISQNSYDASGRLVKTAWGVEGATLTETIYSYDEQGRPRDISGASQPDSQVVFRYDEHGRKSKIETSRAEDYRPNVAVAGSPFEALDRPPNLPGGGTATTLYDEHDHATEVQVTDANGELVKRAIRTYDAQGRVAEEKQTWDNPLMMFPPEGRAKLLEQSGLSDDQLKQELLGQFAKFNAGQFGLYAISHCYDAHGRLVDTNRRIFNREEKIENTYNEHGDIESEITRSVGLESEPDRTPPGLFYSEVRYSYQYDQHENWIEKTVSYRSSPDGTFQQSTATKRTVTYY